MAVKRTSAAELARTGNFIDLLEHLADGVHVHVEQMRDTADDRTEGWRDEEETPQLPRRQSRSKKRRDAQ